MKERENDQKNLERRDRCQHRRVCDSHTCRSRLCRVATNRSEKPRSQADASRPSEIGPHRDGQRLGELGSVTAEFAIVLPAVLLTLFFALSVLAMQSSRIGLIELAAESSRALARGESEGIVALLIDSAGLGSKVSFRTSYSELSVCVELVQVANLRPFGEELSIELSETQCARKGGL